MYLLFFLELVYLTYLYILDVHDTGCYTHCCGYWCPTTFLYPLSTRHKITNGLFRILAIKKNNYYLRVDSTLVDLNVVHLVVTCSDRA